MSKKDSKLDKIEKILRSHAFVTPPFLQHSAIQMFCFTIIPYFTTALPKRDRRLIDLPDGAKLAADCWWQKEKEEHKTIIVLSGLDGFSGSGESLFAKELVMKSYFWGFNVIHLKQRGEADTIHLTTSVINTYLENELACALEQIVRWGITNVYIVGLSAGGYLALLEAGRLGTAARKTIGGIVAISVPLDMVQTWNYIEKNTFYDKLLLKTYKHLIKRRIRIDPPGTWNEQQLKNIKTKKQWFHTYKHMWGYPEKFSTLEEYNEKIDVYPLLAKIKVPTVIINAYDDPVASAEPFTKPLVTDNPYIITLLSKHGGHGGFFTFKKLYGDLDRHWAQNRAIEFIRLLTQQQKPCINEENCV